jgi:hypothetical protein
MDPNLDKANNQQPSPHVVIPAPAGQGEQASTGSSAVNSSQGSFNQNQQPSTPPVFPPQASSNVAPTVPDEANQVFDGLPKSKTISKKAMAILVGLFIVVALPLTVFVSQRQQNTQTGAFQALTPDTIVAIFNGTNIYERDIEQVAAEQYDPNSIDREVLKDSFDILIERKILDFEKTQKNIEVSQDEIDQKANQDGISQVQAQYKVLQDKITKLETKNWQAYTIGFWIPPTDEQSILTSKEKQTSKTQLSDGLKALDDIQALMQTDQAPLDIAREEIVKYPSLGSVLAVNDYLLSGVKDGGDLTNYQNANIYAYDQSKVGNPFFDTLYAMRTPNQVQKVIKEKSGGGDVIKLLDVNPDAQFNNYDAWLKSEKQSLVRVVYNL